MYEAIGHKRGSPEPHVWTSSIIKTLLLCDSMYYRQYVLQQELPEEKEGSATDVGSQVHSRNEKVLKKVPFDEREYGRGKVKRMSENLLATLPTLDVDPAWVEHRFTEKVGPIIVSGTIDLFMPDGVDDWKTTAGHKWECPRCKKVLPKTEPFDPDPECGECGMVVPALWMNGERLAQDVQCNMYLLQWFRKNPTKSVGRASWRYVETKTKESQVHVTTIYRHKEEVVNFLLPVFQRCLMAEKYKTLPLNMLPYVARNLDSCSLYRGCPFEESCDKCKSPLERL